MTALTSVDVSLMVLHKHKFLMSEVVVGQMFALNVNSAIVGSFSMVLGFENNVIVSAPFLKLFLILHSRPPSARSLALLSVLHF